MNYFILIVAIILLINVCFFDSGQNAGIGFRTKKSMSSKKIWVYSQKNFYGIIILVSVIAIGLNYFSMISNKVSAFLSIIGIILAGVMTQLLLIFKEKKESEAGKNEIVMGIVYLSIIIISFFTKTPDIFYSSRIFVLIYFSINLLFKIVKTNK